MLLLIDGYNLLYAIGLGGIGTPAARLDAAREELLQWLASALSLEERRETVIVFDAQSPPAGASSETMYAEMRIVFAVGHRDADELICQMIRETPNPGLLTVVSSDHQIQIQARRRRATPVDSEPWYEQIASRPPPPPIDPHSADASSLDESEEWPFENPFPPGYGEDLL